MDLMCFIMVLFSILMIFYWFLTKSYDYWEKQNVPCLPNPVPGFGHMLPLITLKENISTFALDAYKSSEASAIGFYFIREPGIIVRDPELVRNILQTSFSSFRLNGFHLDEETDPVMAKNPFFATSREAWKVGRARTTSHLSSKKLNYLSVIIQEVCFKMDKYIKRKIERNGDSFECDLKEHFLRYTGEIVANAAFGIEGQSFDDNPDKLAFFNIAKTIFKPTFGNSIKQALLFYLPNIARLLKLSLMPNTADSYFRENVKLILKRRKEANSVQNDFLQFCIDYNGEHDIDSIIADVIIFYGDVYETSSTALASLFYHLSQNIRVQEKLRGDITSMMKENGGEVTYESLKNMNYLDQVIFESMRLLPPAGSLRKKCTEEISITGSDGLKYHLQPGNFVIIPISALHNDKKYYPNPHVFDPDRFSSENVANRHKYVFLPFGEGPKMCVGMRLAIMLVKLATVSVLSKYSIENSDKTKKPLEHDTSSFLLYIKGGQWGIFKKLNLNK